MSEYFKYGNEAIKARYAERLGDALINEIYVEYIVWTDVIF